LVRQAAVIGVPDAERGEMVVAYVVPRDGRTFGFDDMTAHFTSLRLARQKFPERLEIVEALPTNAAGKVMKQDLKAIDASRTGMMGDVANAR
jgi:acyl-CoA synthetase (AMP-forming)/AMP-acid ligase II